MATKYRAFISYSHADGHLAKCVHRWLEAYRPPTKIVGRTTAMGCVPHRLHPIFRDREELPTSADLGEQIRSALYESATLIVICSPRSAASRWVNEEILAFKRLGKSSRILCLIIDGEPNGSTKPGLESQECFPSALRFQLGSDGELSMTPTEPIAADMRSGKDSRRDALLKLAAGIMGVGFDELKQRDLQRQLRKAVIMSAAAAILFVAMAGLATAAWVSRNEAIRQQSIAEAETGRAEQNFRDAREAVDRFYTKVSEEKLLQAEGLQPLRSELLQEALEYYRRFLAQRRNDPAFAYEAAIVQAHVGGILTQVANPREALAANREATHMLEALQSANPADGRLLSALSESLANEAMNLNALDDPGAALERHLQSLQVYERMPVNGAGRSERELLRLLSVKAAYEAASGQLDQAAKSYEAVLAAADAQGAQIAPLGLLLENGDSDAIVVGVIESSPASAAGIEVGDRLRALAGTKISRTADMAVAQKQLAAEKACPIEILRDGKPVAKIIQPVRQGDAIKAAAMYNLGHLLLHRLGQPANAKGWLVRSVDEYRRTLLALPSEAGETRRTLREALAVAVGQVGVCASHLNDAYLAETSLRDAVIVTERLVAENPAVPSYRSNHALNLANLASVLAAKERTPEVTELTKQAIENLKLALAGNGNRPEDLYQLALLMRNLALQLDYELGPQAAIPILVSALQIADSLEDKSFPRAQLDVARAQIHRSLARFHVETEKPSEAVVHYELARKFYESSCDGMLTARGDVLLQIAILDGTLLSLYAELGNEDAVAKSSQGLDEVCNQLSSLAGATSYQIEARIHAVHACTDAAYSSFPSRREAASGLLRLAEVQLEKTLAIPIAEDVDGEQVERTKRYVSAVQLREDLTTGNGVTAWQRLANCLGQSDLETLPDSVKLDLAASLLMADKAMDAAKVLGILRKSLAAYKDAKTADRELKKFLAELAALNVPAEVRQKLKDAL